MSSATRAPTARTSRSLTPDAPLASHEPGDAIGMTLRVSTAVPGQRHRQQPREELPQAGRSARRSTQTFTTLAMGHQPL